MIPLRLPDWQIEWIDRGVAPSRPFVVKDQDGVDIDASLGTEPACKGTLPYPAPRCGYHSVYCRTCGKTAIVSAAGRRDDPRSLKMACNEERT